MKKLKDDSKFFVVLFEDVTKLKIISEILPPVNLLQFLNLNEGWFVWQKTFFLQGKICMYQLHPFSQHETLHAKLRDNTLDMKSQRVKKPTSSPAQWLLGVQKLSFFIESEWIQWLKGSRNVS